MIVRAVLPDSVWCGRRLRPETVRDRPGWARIPAVRHGLLYDIESPDCPGRPDEQGNLPVAQEYARRPDEC